MNVTLAKILEQSTLVRKLHQDGHETDLATQVVALFDLLRDEFDKATEENDQRLLTFAAPQVCSLAERIARVRDDWAHKP